MWREALLARKVLMNRTRGYRHHPQLLRFREERNPVAWINAYLLIVHAEASSRGYSFDKSRIGRTRASGSLVETAGQLAFEWEHLRKKLRRRNREASRRLEARRSLEASPLFRIVRGEVRDWEKGMEARA